MLFKVVWLVDRRGEWIGALGAKRLALVRSGLLLLSMALLDDLVGVLLEVGPEEVGRLLGLHDDLVRVLHGQALLLQLELLRSGAHVGVEAAQLVRLLPIRLLEDRVRERVVRQHDFVHFVEELVDFQQLRGVGEPKHSLRVLTRQDLLDALV